MTYLLLTDNVKARDPVGSKKNETKKDQEAVPLAWFTWATMARTGGRPLVEDRG